MWWTLYRRIHIMFFNLCQHVFFQQKSVAWHDFRVFYVFWHVLLILSLSCPLKFISYYDSVDFTMNKADEYFYFAIWSCNLVGFLQTYGWNLLLLGVRIFLGTMSFGVKPTKMSSVQKGYVKQQCSPCMWRRNLTYGLSKVPEIGVGWLYRRHLKASGMHGWGMHWNASVNGTKISWGEWNKRRIYLI